VIQYLASSVSEVTKAGTPRLLTDGSKNFSDSRSCGRTSSAKRSSTPEKLDAVIFAIPSMSEMLSSTELSRRSTKTRWAPLRRISSQMASNTGTIDASVMDARNLNAR